jgi:MoxR-like ATPase
MEEYAYSLNPDEAIKEIVKAMAVNRPTMLHGSPGLGKSDVFDQIEPNRSSRYEWGSICEGWSG